jgi:excinuclease UvrABC nuclease subunit
MDRYEEAIEAVIQSISWSKIKAYHKKINLYWEFEENNSIVKRIPNIKELQEDIRGIFKHMLAKDLDYISYGNWIIFWDREESIGDIRVIFRLADFMFEEDTVSRKSLEVALDKAIEKEDYEKAAEIRDALNSKTN